MPSLKIAVPPRNRCVVLVPVGSQIEAACEAGLAELERRGYAVWRVRGYAAIDQGRNQMASDALAQGFEETMWIDADVAFEPDDVDRLRCLELPVVCGIYPKKGKRELATHVLPGTQKILFGKGGGLLPILYAATGFLHVRREVYETIEQKLQLPKCNLGFGKAMVPWFQPMVVQQPTFETSIALPKNPVLQVTPVFEVTAPAEIPTPAPWYLAEDYAFSERVRQCGIAIWADTRIRLSHVGSHAFTWEDAGSERPRFASYTYNLSEAKPSPEKPVEVVPSAAGAAEKAIVSGIGSFPANKTWSQIPGWFDYQTLYDAAVERVPSAGALVEVGSWLGRSTAYLAAKIKQSGKSLRFYTVDHTLGSNEPEHAAAVNAAGGNFAGALVNNLVQCGVFDAVVPILTSSLEASRLFAAGSLDFVFLDAAHDYASVRDDIAAWWPKIAPGGMLAGHDYQPDWPEVIRAVDEHFGSRFGVPGRHLAAIECANSWSVIKK